MPIGTQAGYAFALDLLTIQQQELTKFQLIYEFS